jgi:fatty acid desaturase
MTPGHSVMRGGPQELGRLRVPRLPWWLLPVAIDWGTIVLALAAAGVAKSSAVYLGAVFVIGTRQHALAIMGHDGAHRLACRSRWLNDLVTAVLCFWPLGLGITAYRRHHFTHHRHPGTQLDPELDYKRSRAPQWDLPANRQRHLRHFVKDVLGLGLRDLVWVMRVVPPVSVMDVLGPLAWWAAALALIAWTGATWVLVTWFAALATVFWAMFRLRIWTEHVGTAGVNRIGASWWQRLLFLPHNTWCHYEHHRWPSVPCRNLPAARALDRSTPVLSLGVQFEAYRSSARIVSGVPLAQGRSKS